MNKCTGQEFQRNGPTRLAMKWVLHRLGFTLQPRLLLKQRCRKWHDCQHGNIFLLGEFSRDQVSWTTSNPWTRNLASGKTLTWDNLPHSSATPNLVLGWNPWPTSALLHCSLNWPRDPTPYTYKGYKTISLSLSPCNVSFVAVGMLQSVQKPSPTLRNWYACARNCKGFWIPIFPRLNTRARQTEAPGNKIL